jgi:hypothetical protein
MLGPFRIHWVCSKINTMGTTYGAETAYCSESMILPLFWLGSCYSIFVFLCNILLIIVCPFYFWPFYYLSFFDLRLLIGPLLSSYFPYN